MSGADPHQPLRDDVRMLGEMLGDVLRQQRGEDFFQRVESIRRQALAGRQEGGPAMAATAEQLDGLKAADLLDVARAFSQFLNLTNIAEQHHRIRLERGLDDASHEGLDGVVQALLGQGCSVADIRQCLETMSVELVLTAHPTEVTRRTLIRKYDRIAAILGNLDRSNATDYERLCWREELRRILLSSWGTDEIRRQKPTPVDEAKWGFAAVEQSLWEALPAALRALDRVCARHLGGELAVSVAPVRFASWMGGDRDGNPNVTSAVTREVLMLGRWMAADLYLRDVENLLADLSMQSANAELLALSGDSKEPYRWVLRELRDELRATRHTLEALLAGRSVEQVSLMSREQLLSRLQVVDRSLRECGFASVANGELRDTLRRLHAFGINLLTLDVRQESTRHAALLNNLCRHLGLTDYLSLPETLRQAFLLEQLQSRRSLLDRYFYESSLCTDDDRELLDTLTVIAEAEPGSLGAYVISMARAPSDVLAVMLLQRETGVREPMRVVPLFETLDDLSSALDTMSSLLSVDWYRQQIGRGQEIMIGYSDSAKDAGFLAAAWAQYRAQEGLTALFADCQIPLTLFHGRGGSISRGGSPTRLALMSQPPGSVNGRIRVTEQGEVIRFKYGLPAIAKNNIEQYLAATLEATLSPPLAPLPGWREQMQQLSDDALIAYRSVVRDDPVLVRYLRQVTPEQELSRLSLGSRPARRVLGLVER
ncbi:MAG: phosphoenolpyruvate carboxylase, partial [Gammaproteobacteria bacterium HGW-Gammaproteobacteria-14]